MPRANVTRYWTLFPLWQGHFPVIGEGRATARHAGRYLRTQWKVYREWRTLSLSCLLPVASTFGPRGPLLPRYFPGISCDRDVGFHRKPPGCHFPGMMTETQAPSERTEQEFGATAKQGWDQ